MKNLKSIRQGKFFEIEINENDQNEAREKQELLEGGQTNRVGVMRYNMIEQDLLKDAGKQDGDQSCYEYLRFAV